MYRLLIVDDEKQSRIGLSSWSGWHNLGIQIIGCAENGKEALEMVDSLLPDIILTDVKMPEMDGLAFAEHLRRQELPTRIVFISGYDDTSYLKKAFKLNACDYLLKPLDMEELHACMFKIVGEISASQGQNAYLAKALDNYSHGLLEFKTSIIEHALYLGGTSAELKQIRQHIDELPEKGYMISFFAYHQDSQKCGQFLIDLLQASPDISYATRLSSIEHKYSAYLECTEEKLRGYVSKHIAMLMSHGYMPCTVGVSRWIGCFERIREALAEAQTAAQQCLYLPAGSIAVYEEAFDTRADESALLAGFVPDAQLTSMFDNDGESFDSWFVKETERLANAHITNRAACIQRFKEILHNVFELLPEAFQTDEAVDFNEHTAVQQLQNMYCLEQFSTHILKYVYDIRAILHMSSNQASRAIIKRACEYIHANYQNEITVVQLGKAVSMSPTYLCALFKSQTGVTIGNYIRQRRLEKAAELLSKTDTKLYDIALAVGYQNPSYFSKLFRNHYHLTPSVYRERFATGDTNEKE